MYLFDSAVVIHKRSIFRQRALSDRALQSFAIRAASI
jgi:hypothetical protein